MHNLTRGGRTETAALRSAENFSSSERGVRSRPKSVYTRRFRVDRSHGLSSTQGREGGALDLVPGRPRDEGGGHVLNKWPLYHGATQRGKPSALVLISTEDNFDLSTCLISGRREEAEQTRIKPTTPPVRTAPCRPTAVMWRSRRRAECNHLPAIQAKPLQHHHALTKTQ